MPRKLPDRRLLRSMSEGIGVLPDDLDVLRRYLRLIEELMLEKAAEVEPTWALACATAGELAVLQTLENAVAERAVTARAETLVDVCTKLEIWQGLVASSEDGDPGSLSNRLVLSALDDLRRQRLGRS